MRGANEAYIDCSSTSTIGLLHLATAERALHRDSMEDTMHRWQRAGREGADSGHAVSASRLHPVLDTGKSGQADAAGAGWFPSTRVCHEDRGWQQISRWPARVRDIHIAGLLWRQGEQRGIGARDGASVRDGASPAAAGAAFVQGQGGAQMRIKYR